VFVSGRVQGVFFRGTTQDRARALGVRGYVRNLPDGRVEALFEGEQSAVEAAVAFVREGPPHAHVEHVDVRWEPHTGEFRSFDLRYGSDRA
jgi:acylphosphatase